MKQHSPLALVAWLGVALLAHILVALFGVMNRWLQTRPSPPLPALRAALLVSSIALATVAVVDASSRAVAWALRRRQRSRRGRQGTPTAQQADGGKRGAAPFAAAANGVHAVAPPSAAADGLTAGKLGVAGADLTSLESEGLVKCSSSGGLGSSSSASDEKEAQSQQQQQPQQLGRRSQQQPAPPKPPPAPAPPAPSLSHLDSLQQVPQPGDPLPPLRPEMAMERGLSLRVKRLERGQPKLVRHAALAVITVTFATAYLCQTVAPGFLDPALVQLVMSFTVIGVALFQRLLLHHALPLLIWPCSAVMLAGACMILVPTVGKGTSAGLSGWRGWLGFGLALLSMVSTVLYFTSLQASRRMKFTSMQLQYLYLTLCILLLLPLTLAVDGTEWPAQFAAWGAGDWLALVATGSGICVGANLAIQHATWNLGAPTVSIFFGIRLVCSIALSKAVLSRTIITQPVQIAGTVLAVGAVTVYLWWQWRLSKQQAHLAALAAASRQAVEPGGV